MRELGIAKDDANRELEELRKTASQRAAASYRMGMPNMILVLFGSESFNDFSRRMGVSSRVGDWESGIVTELEIANNRSEEKEELLRKERDRAKSAEQLHRQEAFLPAAAGQPARGANGARRSRGTSPRGSGRP